MGVFQAALPRFIQTTAFMGNFFINMNVTECKNPPGECVFVCASVCERLRECVNVCRHACVYL